MKRISLPEDVKSKLKIFLKNNWVGNTPEELTHAWNIQSAHSVGGGEICEVLGEMGILVSDEELERMRDLKGKELEIVRSRDALAMERIKAERVKLMRARLEEMKDIWTGLGSEELAAEKTAAA